MTFAVAGGAGAAVRVKSPVVSTVNVRLAVPRLVVTTSGPVVAPIGTVVVIWVAVTVRTTAARPLNVTVVAPGSKLVPVIVTNVPTGPLAGSTLVIDGPNRTVKVRVAGVRSSFPARSSAFTSNVCDPSVSPVNVAVVAAEKAVKAPPSRRHANWRLPTEVRLSEPLKVKVAVATLISPLGPPVMNVSGGVLSTITTRVAVAEFPAASVAVAPSVWAPSGTVVVLNEPVAVTEAAGGGSGGIRVADSDWPSTLSPKLATPLPLSVACASTVTVWRTYALFVAGCTKLTVGACVSGTGFSKAPMSNWAVGAPVAFLGRAPGTPVKSVSKSGLKLAGRPSVRGSIPRSIAGEPSASVKSSSAVLGMPSVPTKCV